MKVWIRPEVSAALVLPPCSSMASRAQHSCSKVSAVLVYIQICRYVFTHSGNPGDGCRLVWQDSTTCSNELQDSLPHYHLHNLHGPLLKQSLPMCIRPRLLPTAARHPGARQKVSLMPSVMQTLHDQFSRQRDLMFVQTPLQFGQPVKVESSRQGVQHFED